MESKRVRKITLVFVGLAVLSATAGCSMITPPSDDTGDIETETPGTKTETATPEQAGGDIETETPGTKTETATPEQAGGDSGSGGATDERSTTGPIEDTRLPVDENRIYNLTQDLLGSDAQAPTITFKELNYRSGKTNRPFFDYMGLTNESAGSASGAEPAAISKGPNSVVVNEDIVKRYGKENADRFGMVLAHEFTHTIQMEEGWSRFSLARKLNLSKTESMLLYRSLVEGGAVFTADEYADRVGVNRSQKARFAREYRKAAAELVYAYAPYHHGSQYFDQILNSSREVGSVYTDDTPATTEAVIHPGYNDTEPSEVTFSAESSRDGWTRQPSMDDQLGAMFVNVVLTAHTEEDIANKASKGWANDQVLGFKNGSRSAFAWVTHWDSAEDADQFADAFNQTLLNRSDEDVGDVEVVRAGNRSVVVLTGPEEFRDAVTVDGENANIDVGLRSAAKDSVKSPVMGRHG